MLTSILPKQNAYLTFHFLLWFWSAFTLMERARWDPNPHHDGVIIAPAIAVNQGKVPNLEVFSQYGFLFPYLQSFWLKFTPDNLVSLRFFAVIQVLISAGILFEVLRRFISPHLSSLLGVAWLLSFPNLLPFLPWPSVTTTLLTLFGLLNLLKLDGSNNRNQKFLILAFSSLFLASLIRPQIYLTLPVVIYLAYREKQGSSNKKFKDILRILLFPIFVFLFSLSTGAFLPYINYSILWAGGNYSGIGFNLRGLIELGLVPFYGGVIFLGVFLTLRVKNKLLPFTFWVTFTLLHLFFLVSYSWEYKNFPYMAFKHPKILLANLGWNSLNSLSFFVFCCLVYVLFRKLYNYALGDRKGLLKNDLIFIIPVFSILQLYPATDPLHFWWLIPIFLIGVAMNIRNVKIIDINSRYMIVPLILFIFTCSFNFVHDFSKDRIAYEESILAGMIGFPSEVSYIDETFNLVSESSASEGFVYDCADGLYAVRAGTYNLKDGNYVNWAPDFQPNFKDSELVFQCNISRKTPLPEGFRLITEVQVRSGEYGLTSSNVNRISTRKVSE